MMVCSSRASPQLDVDKSGDLDATELKASGMMMSIPSDQQIDL